MKKISVGLCVLSTALFVVGAQAEVLRGPRVINEIKHDVSLPLRDMAKMTPVQKNANREIENRIPRVTPRQVNPGVDEAQQKIQLPLVGTTGLLNFDGQGADGVAPPDTNGSVGGTQYVQWVNLEYNVYDKTSGALLLGPVQGNSFWSGFSNTACANNNDGDPIVIFDKLAGRWFVAQNVFVSPYTICLAVSATNDATGSYTRYAFAISPSGDFPDYPKWGVWPDAYYNTYNAFPSGAEHAEACAADRNSMLAGNTATIQCFKLASTYVNLLPADLDGNTAPPSGAPNYFFGLGGTTTSVRLWQFHVDFVTPSNSTFTGPTSLTVPNYTKVTQQRTCVSQPSGGETLDCLGGRPQYRFAYRNFGTYESLLATHTVKPTGTGVTAKGAVRWYEIRTPATPTLFQSGTVSNTTTSYWMSSIAQDKQGNMGLGFSAASTSLDPSVYYTGRLVTDATGTMESNNTVITGTGVQKSTSHRWGDYSSMSVDPADDCTFYFTEEYIKTTGSFAWSTRINSFKFPGCI